MVVSRRPKSAFTLIEILLVTGLLSILTIALFQAFDYGATAFRRATARQDSQSALRKAYSALRDDLRKTHFQSVSVIPKTALEGETEYQRNALSFVGLKEWNSPSSFDEVNGVPKWDRYLVYYGTSDGKLVRSYIDHDRPDFSPAPFLELDPALYLNDDPELNRGYQSTYRILSEQLLDFSATTKPNKETVQVSCTLKNKIQKMSQIKLSVFPQNTWPKGSER